jgi:subfamily B ATP-binding cassette protein MsbA
MVAVSLLALSYGWLVERLTYAVQDRRLAQLDRYAFLALAVFVSKALFGYGQAYLMANVAQRLAMQIRNEIYAHLQRLSLAFFERRQTGQLMASITSDVPVLQHSLTTGIVEGVTAPVIIVGGTVYLFVMNWQLALVSLTCLPLMAACIVSAGRRMRRYSAQVQGALGDISAVAEETLVGVRIVRSFAMEEYEIARFGRQSLAALRSIMRSVRVRAALSALVEMLGTLGVLIVIWVAGHLALGTETTDPKMVIPKLTAFLVILNQIGAAARNLGNVHLNFQQVSAAATRIFELLDIEPEIRERPGAIELPRLEGHVRFENVSFHYTEGPPVLDGIDFELLPGEIGAIVGATGAGKSTIANLIPRFYDVQDGAVLIDGIDVRDATLVSLRRQVGIVPQETMLFSGTIRENIAYGRLHASSEEIEAAARAAYAHDFIQRLPQGYDTIVGERGQKLSGGQRQRIAIARAVLKDPRILILDEATSSLDMRSEKRVQEALEKLMVSRTTLIIAHRLSTVRNADKIFVLDGGRIVEQGTYDDLLARDGVFTRLVRAGSMTTEDRRPRGRRTDTTDDPTGRAPAPPPVRGARSVPTRPTPTPRSSVAAPTVAGSQPVASDPSASVGRSEATS